MKKKTIWKKSNTEIVGKRLFNDKYNLGFFTITKIQKCKEYCKNAETPSGSHWFDTKRAFVKTDSGLKYIIPFLPLYLSSVDENGNYLPR